MKVRRFNQLRAVRNAGGGHKLAADAALHLPWGGIFEAWRPLIIVAAAAEGVLFPPEPEPAAVRCRSRRRRLLEAAGQRSLAFPATGARPVTAEDPITDDDIPF